MTRTLKALLGTVFVLAIFVVPGVVWLALIPVLAYVGYVGVLWWIAQQRSARIERGHLAVVRKRDGALRADVDLGRPFTVECVHHNGDWALYVIQQDGKAVRFALPRDPTGEAVAHAIHVRWPPPVAPSSWFIR